MKWIFLMMIATSLHAKDYFVSTEGSDQAPGTETQPWATIQHAANVATPGSTVHIKGGIYEETITINVEGNEKEGWITFKPYHKDHVVIRGGEKEYDNIHLILIEDKSYLKILGLELRDLKVSDGAAICVKGCGEHLVIQNNTIHEIRGGGEDGGAVGIGIYGNNDKKSIHHILIDSNTIFNCDPAWSEALTLNGNVEHFEVINNTIHDVNNIGIDFIGGEDWIGTQQTRNGICRNNRVYHARSSYESGYAAGIYVDGGYDIRIEDNEVYECDLGIEVGAENSGYISHDIIVQRNQIHNNDKAGIVFGGYNSRVGKVKNCSFIENILTKNDQKKTGVGEIWIQYATDNRIEKNRVTPNSENLIVYSENKNQNNTMDYSIYCPTKASDALRFVWNGKLYSGLKNFQKNTHQDHHAKICETVASEG